MKYWLFKSEPSTFSIDSLAKAKQQTTHWDGVRNYQARNFMRNEMQVGDLGYFYHSNCENIGIAGSVRVVKTAYPDFTAWEPGNDHFDAASTPEQPRWFMVDVQLVERFDRVITLAELKATPGLQDMLILRKGNRLSITPLTAAEWQAIQRLAH